MAYTVIVGDFEGPFDLLLKLIAQRRVDVYDVALADITDEYLAVIRTMDIVDLEATTEFLVIAATLVELKAARLLPSDEDPEVDELAMHARDLLYARLLDFQVFAEAAAFLGGRMADQQGYVPRDVALEPQFVGLVPPVQLTTTAQDLARLYGDLLVRAEERDRPVDTSHLPPVRLTVAQAAHDLLTQLDVGGGRATFRALTAQYRHAVEVAVAFLAVLELYKDGDVEVEQSHSFGDIVVERGTDDRVRVVADEREVTAARDPASPEPATALPAATPSVPSLVGRSAT